MRTNRQNFHRHLKYEASQFGDSGRASLPFGFKLACGSETGQTVIVLSPRHAAIEGYYGRILGRAPPDRRPTGRPWHERYVYAPKEDINHRIAWRTAWDGEWYADFAYFCAHAAHRNIQVLAGIAPGRF